MSVTSRSLPLPIAWPLRAGWALLNVLQLAFTLAWTAGLIGPAFLARALTRGARVPLRMAARLWAPGLLTGAGARLRVDGAERVDWSQPCVLVANHQSIIDICALFAAVPVPLRFVLKQEMTRVPLVGRYARAMGMVFIDRAGRRAAVRSLRQAVDVVRGGAVLCVFPEGTRSRDGRVGPFKPGAFEIALAAGVPVVPVAIAGSGAVLPSAGFSVRPGTIDVRFGAPLQADAAAADPRGALALRARQAVLDLMQPHD